MGRGQTRFLLARIVSCEQCLHQAKTLLFLDSSAKPAGFSETNAIVFVFNSFPSREML